MTNISAFLFVTKHWYAKLLAHRQMGRIIALGRIIATLSVFVISKKIGEIFKGMFVHFGHP